MTFSDWAERHYGSEDLALVDCVKWIECAGGGDFAELSDGAKAKAVELFVGWIATNHSECAASGFLAGTFLDALVAGELQPSR